jgi:Asp/Glu/hydantoin racemase
MRSILIINPNSTESMTNGLKPLVDALQFKDVTSTKPLTTCFPATDHS